MPDLYLTEVTQIHAMPNFRNQLFDYWEQLYPGVPAKILENFLLTIGVYSGKNEESDFQADWYKDAVVYSLYADLFNNDFTGLTQKLDYLHDLGINCIWILPVLDSPMRDAGFDISDYKNIRSELLDKSGKTNDQNIFRKFLTAAHEKGIKVIFDISMNHTSDEHPWFVEAAKSKDNPFRDYYIWSEDTDLYNEARIIFKGIEGWFGKSSPLSRKDANIITIDSFLKNRDN